MIQAMSDYVLRYDHRRINQPDPRSGTGPQTSSLNADESGPVSV